MKKFLNQTEALEWLQDHATGDCSVLISTAVFQYTHASGRLVIMGTRYHVLYMREVRKLEKW